MATINGTKNDDLLIGTAGDDDISGGDGVDTIQGLTGNDTLDGGKDGDVIDGNEGDDSIDGVFGNDTISGGDGNDTVDGGSGNDDIEGNDGADDLDGGSGHDTIDGGTGNDTIDGGSGDDVITAGSGNDLIDAASGHDTVTGGEGDDTIIGGSGQDVAAFAGSIGDFTISQSGTDLIIDDQNTGDGDEGTDTVNDEVFFLQFGDYTLDLTSQANNAPVVQTPLATTDEDNSSTFTMTVVDFDGDAVTTPTLSVTSTNAVNATVANSISIVGGPAPGTTGLGSATDFSVQFNPGDGYQWLAAGESVTETVTVTSTDEHGATFTQTFDVTITGVNDDPEANDVTATAGEDGPGVVINADYSDVDASDTHTFSVDDTGTLGSVTENGDGTFSYDPNGQFESLADGESATDTFSYTVDDGNGGTDTATVTVTVTGANDDPEANDVAATASEDGPGVVINADYSDVDASDTHTISVDDTGTLGIVTNNGDGTFSYDPNGQFESLAVGETATDTFSYTVDDGNGGTDTATVTVTITGANDDPVANDVAATVSEDGPIASISADFSDIDASDTHTFSVDTTGTSGRVSNNGDGTFSYDPDGQFDHLADGESATDTFTYTVDDGNGGTSTATVTVTVTGQNDAPQAGAVADIFNEVNGQNIVIDLNDYVTDPDLTDNLFFTNITQSRDVLPIPFTVIGNGLISINPDDLTSGGFGSPDGIGLGTGESVVTAFTFGVSDDSGATNNSDTGVLTVTINGLNEPTPAGNSAPTAHVVDLTGLDEADGIVSIPFSDLATDPDIGDELTITSMTWVDQYGITRDVEFTGAVNTGEGGDVIIDLTQFFLEEGDLEVISISFTVEDAAGESSSSTVSLEIAGDTPGAGNTPPVAQSIPTPIPGPGNEIIQDVIVDDPGTTTLEIDLSALVSDPDGDPLTITVDAFVIGYSEDGVPITAPYSFDEATGIVTITLADLGLADGESLIGTLQYSVSDGTDTTSGEVTYNYVNPEDGTGAETVALDFEPFSSDSGATIDVTAYEGFTFYGSATVIETDELTAGDGRDGDNSAGIIGGQTTVGGDNVLVGTYSEIDVPVFDETGAPVLDERGEQVIETVVDETFGFTGPGTSFGIGDQGLFYATLAPGLDPDLPTLLPDGIGTSFNLDGLSLNVVGADNVTVTITLYTIDIVEGDPNPFFPTNSDYYYTLVEVDSFEFTINASDGAEVLDFNAVDFADDAPGADDITSFDGVYAVGITTDDGTAVVIDDILITI
ncbi:Ig-like domain-containing protein [Alisedimentitalea sp. MJ-SS2]|uniref:tandem-95 repeat protein n=1 Tax=Aliisedimentitalea sp. MJ-SS2 TaxID=3049795 RepID=UPI002909B0EF|nr:Ig-like domain-containing protein [Alisedimentitalea sp. MJ-SS2]MDU8927363.1 Ig-like domain-containing protein [Alisedimentitalea sp. MJ-SS2]